MSTLVSNLYDKISDEICTVISSASAFIWEKSWESFKNSVHAKLLRVRLVLPSGAKLTQKTKFQWNPKLEAGLPHPFDNRILINHSRVELWNECFDPMINSLHRWLTPCIAPVSIALFFRMGSRSGRISWMHRTYTWHATFTKHPVRTDRELAPPAQGQQWLYLQWGLKVYHHPVKQSKTSRS